MAFTKETSLVGSTEKYRLAEGVKKYTLRDNGFEETSSGNYQFIRPLDASPENKQGIKLKIVVNQDLQSFKMSTTTSNGLRAVNIYSNENFKLVVDKFNFIMAGFIERGVFEKV